MNALKKIITAIAFATLGLSAQAQTTYNLHPETCINLVCSSTSGVATDPPAPFTVDYFYDSRPKGYSVAYGINIDGTMFTGIGGGIAQAPDGRQVSLVTNWTTRRTCVRQGRGQHCSTFYIYVDGAVTVYFQ
jgi:hypothetical protein